MTGQPDLGGLPPNREPNRLLREQRRARGWKQDDVAAGIEDLAQQLAEPMSLITAGLVDKWERGVRRPGRYYGPRLCLLFGLPPRELGLGATPRLVADCRRLSAELGAEPGVPIGAPSDLKVSAEELGLSGSPLAEPEESGERDTHADATDVPVVNRVDSADDPSADAIDLSRLIDGSDVGPCAIPSLEQAVLRLRRAYSKTPPPDLAVALRDRLRFVRHLLRRPIRPSNRSDVLAAAGWLTLLLSTVYSDLRQHELAHTYRDLALHLGNEVGDTELQAWAWDTSAWFALLDGRYRDAIRCAQAGQAVAPSTSVKVAVNLQEARAWARLGAESDTMDAMRRAQAALEPLSYPDHPDDHYTFDPAKFDFYAATCYGWLGKSRLAERHAREVIAAFSDPTGSTYWPTRVATTRIDLATALTQRGELDEAGHQGCQAFDTPFVRRTTLERAAELDALLRGHQDVSQARDFHDRYRDLLGRR